MKDSPLHRPLPGVRKGERGRRGHREGGEVAGGDHQLFGWAKERKLRSILDWAHLLHYLQET